MLKSGLKDRDLVTQIFILRDTFYYKSMVFVLDKTKLSIKCEYQNSTNLVV